jgi:hypothetical protein
MNLLDWIVIPFEAERDAEERARDELAEERERLVAAENEHLIRVPVERAKRWYGSRAIGHWEEMPKMSMLDLYHPSAFAVDGFMAPGDLGLPNPPLHATWQTTAR